MKSVLVTLFSCLSLIAVSQTSSFSFVNKPFSDPELPNYHRGAHCWNGVPWDNVSAPQVPVGTLTGGAKTLYTRYQWCFMESDRNKYTFTRASLGTNGWKSVQASLEWCANNGALFGFGVMTAYDNGNGVAFEVGVGQYPLYLHKLMQKESTKDWLYNKRDWIPNWNSPSYLSRWQALNDTLLRYIRNWSYTPLIGPWVGKLVKGKDLIDFVDLRGYGNFGEWHTWPWTKSQPAKAICTDSSMKKIIDISVNTYGDYPLHIPMAIFDDAIWSESNAWRAWYVLTLKTRYGVLGWRADGIGQASNDNTLVGNTWSYGNWRADTAIADRWKYAMITGEPMNGSGPCCPYYYDVRREIDKFHFSGFGNGNYGNRTQQTWDTINAVYKLTGYRFNLNDGSMTTTLVQNNPFTVSLSWRNVGASPLYQKRWRVVYQLKTDADVEVKKWTSRFSPYLFLPAATDSVMTENFDLGNVPVGTTYKLTVKFEDTAGLLAPLFIAINSPSRNTDGSYTLRSNITVSAIAMTDAL